MPGRGASRSRGHLVTPGNETLTRLASEHLEPRLRRSGPYPVVEHIRFARVTRDRRRERQPQSVALERETGPGTGEQNVLGVVHPRVGRDANVFAPGQQALVAAAPAVEQFERR